MWRLLRDRDGPGAAYLWRVFWGGRPEPDWRSPSISPPVSSAATQLVACPAHLTSLQLMAPPHNTTVSPIRTTTCAKCYTYQNWRGNNPWVFCGVCALEKIKSMMDYICHIGLSMVFVFLDVVCDVWIPFRRNSCLDCGNQITDF